MGMARNRSSAVGAVVEYYVVFQTFGKVQHVRETVPYSLRNVDVTGYDKMIGENGSAVYEDVVSSALAAFERQFVLFFKIIFLAQGAAVVEDWKAAGIGL
jgi:hypothetical protein